MKKGNPLSLGSYAGDVVNQPDARSAATLQSCVQIVHGEADMVDRGASLRDKSSDRRIRRLGLQQLHYRPSGVQSDDSRSVRVGQIDVRQSQYFPVERQNLGDGAHGNPDMGDSRALRA